MNSEKLRGTLTEQILINAYAGESQARNKRSMQNYFMNTSVTQKELSQALTRLNSARQRKT